MEYQFFGYAVVGLVSALLYFLAHAIPGWILKKYMPGAEWWVNAPISAVIARLIARRPKERQQVPSPSQEKDAS